MNNNIKNVKKLQAFFYI